MSAPKKRRTAAKSATATNPVELDYSKLAAEIIRQQSAAANVGVDHNQQEPAAAGATTGQQERQPARTGTRSGPNIGQQETASTASGEPHSQGSTGTSQGKATAGPSQATGIISILDDVFGGESSRDRSSSPIPIRLTDGIPLGATVPQRVKQKIWEEDFLDFACLLPSYSEEPLSIEIAPGVVRLQQQAKGKTQLSMQQWTSCFLVFMAVYLEKKPTEVQHLLKYAANVRDIHQHYGDNAWRSYDQSFRKLRQSHHIPWQRPVDELWERARHAKPPSASYPSHQQNRGNRGNKRSNQPFRKKFCFAYNNGETCSQQPCKYRHMCQTCDGAHGRHQCTKHGKQNQQPNARKARSNSTQANANK